MPSSRPPVEVCSFFPLIDGPICTEVIRQVGAQRPELAIAMAEAFASGSGRTGEQLGAPLNPYDLDLVMRVCSGVLAYFGVPVGKA